MRVLVFGAHHAGNVAITPCEERGMSIRRRRIMPEGTGGTFSGTPEREK
jgi:hypothetical protein